MSRVSGKSSKAKRNAKRVKPVTKRQLRKSVKRAQLKIRKTTLEVRRPVSLRGRTHPMEAALPGMPGEPQGVLMESTAIARFKYYIEEKRLRVWFQSGHVYDYFGVPESVVIALSRAQSVGRYFYYNIRTQYRFRRVR